MKALISVCVCSMWSLFWIASGAAEETIDLNRGWSFHLGDADQAANADFNLSLIHISEPTRPY